MRIDNRSIKNYKRKFLRELTIANLSSENIEDVILLIKEEYGNNYYNPIFYNKEVIKYYVKKIENREKIYWKCAFHQGTLIGQTFLEILHGIGYLKLTIISKLYRHQGILTKLYLDVIKNIKHIKSDDFRYVYTFVSNENTHLLNFIHKYGFKKLGETPFWSLEKNFIILGRSSVIKKDQWKMISIHMDLFKDIFKVIKNIKLKRYIQAHSKVPKFNLNRKKRYEIKLTKIEDIINNKILFRGHKDHIIAELYENVINKSWFDFQFKINIDNILKIKIIEFLLEEFKKAKDINSLSLSIDVNDYILQKYLLDVGLKCYAYFPFYSETDKILMGVSKINPNGGKNDE